jgi:phosphoglycolate phosphatase
MIQAIIFDLDGTLVDSCGICIGILEGMMADRGVDRSIDPEHARAFLSRGGVTMVAALLGDACSDPAADLVEFRKRYSEVSTPADSLFGGVAAGLQRLCERGFRLAICSNKPQALCEKVLNDTGIAKYFVAVVGGMEGLAAKPAPDLLDRTLEKLQLPADKCFYVGDSKLDHEVAERAGIPFYFLTYGYAESGWTPPGSALYDHFSPLVDDLTRHGRAHLAA